MSVLLMAAFPDSGRLVVMHGNEAGLLWALKGSVLIGGLSDCFSSNKNVLVIVVTRFGCCEMFGVPTERQQQLCCLHSGQRNVLLMGSRHLDEDPPRPLIYSRSPFAFALPHLDKLEGPQLL